MEKSDKAKTGNDPSCQRKQIIFEDTPWVPIGRLPVMVNSNLCWLHKDKKSDHGDKGSKHADKESEHDDKESDCLFDSGGYFLIKGMEKVKFY